MPWDSYPLFSRDLQLDLLLPHLLPLAVVPAEGSSLLLGLLLPGHLTEDVLIRICLTATGNSVIIRSYFMFYSCHSCFHSSTTAVLFKILNTRERKDKQASEEDGLKTSQTGDQQILAGP